MSPLCFSLHTAADVFFFSRSPLHDDACIGVGGDTPSLHGNHSARNLIVMASAGRGPVLSSRLFVGGQAGS
jgi:hypothetical protein